MNIIALDERPLGQAAIQRACGNCRHWTQRENDTFGDCDGIRVMDHYEADDLTARPQAYAVFGEVGGGDMITHYTFGCVLWEKKL